MLMGKSTISMVIFNSNVSLPEGSLKLVYIYMPKDITRYLDLVVRSCYLTYGKWSMEIDDNLVGGLEHVLFVHILGRFIPTD